MSWWRDIPTLYGVAVVLTLLALWAGDVRGVYLAAACVVIGAGQQVRDALVERSGRPRPPDVDRD